MKPDDVSQEAWDAAMKASIALARAITAAVAAEREACAEVADNISAGRSRQKMQATTAKKRIEARDFESMAMSAIDVSYKIRARSTSC